jgi:hypothetical protein
MTFQTSELKKALAQSNLVGFRSEEIKKTAAMQQGLEYLESFLVG